MHRVAGTLAVCMVVIAACDSPTQPDPCAGVAREGELELFIAPTPGMFGAGEIVFVDDTLALYAEVSEVLGVSTDIWGSGLCQVDYGPPIQAAIEWSSSDDRVATVSATGLVVGRAPGDAIISARAPALALSATREIGVRVRGAGGP